MAFNQNVVGVCFFLIFPILYASYAFNKGQMNAYTTTNVVLIVYITIVFAIDNLTVKIVPTKNNVVGACNKSNL